MSDSSFFFFILNNVAGSFMKKLDPVVLSSGKVMDRSSVVDRDGNLLFSRCPFTGRRLRYATG